MIEFTDSRAIFSDVVSVEDAENLLAWLHQHPCATADFGACSHVHPANLQVLMAAGTRVDAWPEEDAFCRWLKTALYRN